MRDRSRARKLALQALFQWYFNPAPAYKIIEQFQLQHATSTGKMDWELFDNLLSGVVREYQLCDDLLQPHLSRQLNSLDPLERQLLRMACYELLNHPETPTLAVIDDAIHLARGFGATDSYKLINAVLDKLVRNMEFRKTDMSRPI